MLKDTSTSLDRRVQSIHQAIFDASRAAALHANAMMSMIGSTQQNSYLARLTSVERMPYPGFLVVAIENGSAVAIDNVTDDSTSFVTAEQKTELAENTSDKDESNPCSHRLCTSPATALELSGNYFPVSYTNNTLVPKLVIASSHEQNWSGHSRTNRHQVLCFPSPRRWIILNVSFEISRSSAYWEIVRVSNREYTKGHNPPVSMPGSLIKKLVQKLEENETLKENVHIRFVLLKDNVLRLEDLQQAEQSSPQFNLILPSTPSEPSPKVILANLGDLGCRKYFKDEIVQVASLGYPNSFLACIYGTLVQETKLLHRPLTINSLYDIQARHYLRKVSGVLGLIGVTVDRTETRLKSYLMKLPNTRCQYLLNRVNKCQPCSWQRIENWASRLIEIIRDVHFEGYVVGTLWFAKTPVLVDSFDAK